MPSLQRVVRAARGIPHLRTALDKGSLAVHVQAPTQAQQDHAWQLLAQGLA